MYKLKPCPFCGGEAEICELRRFVDVRCRTCGADFFEKTTVDALIEKWNRRAEVAHMEYDREEFHDNCTVHVLWNSETGEQSIGWWKSDNPPEVIR